MALFAGFVLALLVILGVRHQGARGFEPHTPAERKVAIVEVNLLATALLERDKAELQGKFQVTDYQARAYFQRHPEKFRTREGQLPPFEAARSSAIQLASEDRHDQIMLAYMAAARDQVGYLEGPAAQAAAFRLKLAVESGDPVLALIGKRVVTEADFDLFLQTALDEAPRRQFADTPGARELYLRRFLDFEVLAGKARLEGVR